VQRWATNVAPSSVELPEEEPELAVVALVLPFVLDIVVPAVAH